MEKRSLILGLIIGILATSTVFGFWFFYSANSRINNVSRDMLTVANFLNTATNGQFTAYINSLNK